MKISRTTSLRILAIITAVTWVVSVGLLSVSAASLFHAADNTGAGFDQSWDRGFECSEVTEFCYAIGGGTAFFNDTDATYRYDPVTDSWSAAAITNLPAAELFGSYASGSNNGILIFSTGATNYIYTESTDSFQTVANPVGFNGGFGFGGLTIDDEYYLMEAVLTGNVFIAYNLDITNPGGGWSAHSVPYTEATNMQLSKAVYDPVNQVIVIVTHINGLTWIYSPITGELTEGISNAFPPCAGAGSFCVPSFMTYDADLGVVAGQQGDPSSTSIGLYQFDADAQAWSASTVETLTAAEFNSLQFTQKAPKNSSYTIDGITTTMFGSGIAPNSSPADDANEWFIRTGDPGGFSPVERDIDSWLANWLESLGLNSAFGILLVGTLFSMTLFLLLAVRGVPWIISISITGLGITFLTAAALFNPAILLGLLAIAGVGAIALLMAIFVGGDRSAG